MCCFHTAVNEEKWILYKYIVLLNLNKKEKGVYKIVVLNGVILASDAR